MDEFDSLDQITKQLKENVEYWINPTFGNFEENVHSDGNDKNVYICYQGRITTQKGISVLISFIIYTPFSS